MNDVKITHNQTETTTLYGAPISYYSGKARAYLRWKGIPFKEVCADPTVYRDLIIPTIGYPIIPVVTTDDKTLQDTTDIIDYFEQIKPTPNIYPKTPKQNLVSLLLEVYGDEWLLLPAMHYRWNWNEEWAYTEFGKITSPDANPAQQRIIGEKIAAPFRGSLPYLGITETTIPLIEKSYEALLTELDTHFSQYNYLLGNRPCMGDFGLIGPLYAHLYRDPKSGELMKKLAPNVAVWVERMVAPPTPEKGDFLDHDTIPTTLIPLLKRMWREQIPVLSDTAVLFSAWQKKHNGEPIPRTIGQHTFKLDDVAEQRIVNPFSLWMVQRPLDFLRSLNELQKGEVNELLDVIGDTQLRDFPEFPRLKRENYKLVCNTDS